MWCCTDGKIMGEGERQLGEGQIKAINLSGACRYTQYTCKKGFCIISQSADTWRADICVGQLAMRNGISAQITFHTSLVSPATLSHLNICGRYTQALSNPPIAHTMSTCKWKVTHTHKYCTAVCGHQSRLVQSCGVGGGVKGLQTHSGFANKSTKEDGCSLTN